VAGCAKSVNLADRGGEICGFGRRDGEFVHARVFDGGNRVRARARSSVVP